MALSNLSDQELINYYNYTKLKLLDAEDQVHTAYTVYGGEYGEMIDAADEYEKACKDTFNAIKDEMERRGMKAMDDA